MINGEDTKPVSMIAIVPTKNALGRVDVTGAFLPEANRFRRVHDARGECAIVERVDNTRSRPVMREQVLSLLRGRRRLRCVAFFCHGFRLSIQFGFSVATLGELADMLAATLRPDGVVALYACDAGRDDDNDQEDDLQAGPGGEGGFADSLADALRDRGWRGWVDAHPVAGHTTKNRYVRRFLGSDHGGHWIVEPRSRLWPKWSRALRNTDFRVIYPVLTDAEIIEHIEGA